MQATHTAEGVDLGGVARSVGLPVVVSASTEEDVPEALDTISEAEGPVFAMMKISAENLPFSLPPKDGAWLKDRFRHAVLGPAGVNEA